MDKMYVDGAVNISRKGDINQSRFAERSNVIVRRTCWGVIFCSAVIDSYQVP